MSITTSYTTFLMFSLFIKQLLNKSPIVEYSSNVSFFSDANHVIVSNILILVQKFCPELFYSFTSFIRATKSVSEEW